LTRLRKGGSLFGCHHAAAAFDHVGKQEGRDQGKNDAENRDAVSEDWGPSRSDAAVAK